MCDLAHGKEYTTSQTTLNFALFTRSVSGGFGQGTSGKDPCDYKALRPGSVLSAPVRARIYPRSNRTICTVPPSPVLMGRAKSLRGRVYTGAPYSIKVRYELEIGLLPSTGIPLPVTSEVCSDTRNSAVRAISSD